MQGISWKTFVMLGLVALLGGCGKSANQAAPANSSSPAPTRWEYAVFNYSEPDYQSYKDTAVVCYVHYLQWDGTGKGVWVGSNNLYSVEAVLNQVGGYGWDLAWTDGHKFIVKRTAGAFTNGTFVVNKAMFPIQK